MGDLRWPWSCLLVDFIFQIFYYASQQFLTIYIQSYLAIWYIMSQVYQSISAFILTIDPAYSTRIPSDFIECISTIDELTQNNKKKVANNIHMLFGILKQMFEYPA